SCLLPVFSTAISRRELSPSLPARECAAELNSAGVTSCRSSLHGPASRREFRPPVGARCYALVPALSGGNSRELERLPGVQEVSAVRSVGGGQKGRPRAAEFLTAQDRRIDSPSRIVRRAVGILGGGADQERAWRRSRAPSGRRGSVAAERGS